MSALIKIILMAGFLASGNSAFAADKKVYDDCNGSDPDLRLTGCAAVIADKTEPAKNRSIAFYQRGRVYQLKRDYDRAVSDYNEAIKLNPKYAEALYFRGAVHDKQGDYDGGLVDLNQAVALAPGSNDAVKLRDYVQDKLKHYEQGSETLGALNGTWEGELKNVDLKGDGKTSTQWYRVVIDGRQASVFYKKDDKIIEVKPGQFRVERHLTNAIVMAIDSGLDNEGLWVETWVYAVTPKDRNTLIANLMRVVNNNNLPITNDHSKFSSALIGELQRK
jgi:tetratricopeptide (TPR) repeat protein